MLKEKSARPLPFEVTRGFNAMPNAVSDLYVRHPKFSPTVERIYRYLLRCYNAEHGYAWPSYTAIMRATNTGSRETVSGALSVLEHLRLIERVRFGDNNGYKFAPPIEDEDEFYRAFGPELSPKYGRSDGDVGAIINWI